MNNQLQYTLLFGSCILFVGVLFLIKKRNLQIKYAIIWLITSMVFIIWSLFPKIVTFISNILGVKYESNVIFLILICFFIILHMIISVSSSRDNERIKTLAQEIGLLRKKIEEITNEKEKTH